MWLAMLCSDSVLHCLRPPKLSRLSSILQDSGTVSSAVDSETTVDEESGRAVSEDSGMGISVDSGVVSAAEPGIVRRALLSEDLLVFC